MRALGIEGVQTELSAWTKLGDEQTDGTQVDMLLIRGDRVVNMFEFTLVLVYPKIVEGASSSARRAIPR